MAPKGLPPRMKIKAKMMATTRRKRRRRKSERRTREAIKFKMIKVRCPRLMGTLREPTTTLRTTRGSSITSWPVMTCKYISILFYFKYFLGMRTQQTIARMRESKSIKWADITPCILEKF